MPSLKRIHVLGASGSGTSTLGRALASHYAVPFIDSDDIFWEKTDPPYTTINPHRENALAAALPGDGWVFSGSSLGWGDFLRGRFTHVIFLTLDPSVRLDRLRAREHARFGGRVEKGGDLHQQHLDFLAWAAQYDKGHFQGRSRMLHEKWLRDLPCPVLRLNGALPTEIQVAEFEKFCRPLFFTLQRLSEAAAKVNPFYESLGRSARARPGEVFFVAEGAKGETLGCVRYCEEEGIPMLRSMLVAEEARKRGVGTSLLQEFEAYLREKRINGTYCVPFAHLEAFYAQIGFRPVEEAPPFLLERMRKYRSEGQNVLLMRRP